MPRSLASTLGPDPATSPVIAEWLERFSLIEADVEQLLVRRYVYRRLQEIVHVNPKLDRPSYLYTYLGATYVASSAVGVRRHVRQDDEHRDGSLRGLLYAIRKVPQELTRARHLRFFTAAGMPDRFAQAGERDFDDLVEPGAAQLEDRHVQPDIDALLGAARAVERFATQRIAHLDRTELREIPTEADLDASLDQLERIVGRYRRLLRGQGGEVLPVLDGGWEAVLMEPWIPPRTGAPAGQDVRI
jgi:hypothetical protein